MQRQSPDLIGARHGEEQRLLVLREYEPVGARDLVDEAIDIAVDAQAKHASARVLQAGLPLIGEIEIAVAGEGEIVRSLEAFAAYMFEHRFDASARHIQRHDAALVIGDEDAAIFVNGKTVRPSVIFGGNAPFRIGRDAQDAAIWDVGDIKVAGAIEARSFKEGMKRIVALPEGPAGPAILDAQPLRKTREDTGFDPLNRLKRQQRPPRYFYEPCARAGSRPST
jgi:hypothetical protein